MKKIALCFLVLGFAILLSSGSLLSWMSQHALMLYPGILLAALPFAYCFRLDEKDDAVSRGSFFQVVMITNLAVVVASFILSVRAEHADWQRRMLCCIGIQYLVTGTLWTLYFLNRSVRQYQALGRAAVHNDDIHSDYHH